MKRSKFHLLLAITGMVVITAQVLAADPRVDLWFTELSGKYARVYLTDADRLADNAVSTWSRGTISQTVPAYCGVYEVATSVNWAYVRTTGLGSHTMGPWYTDLNHTRLTMNVPRSFARLYRFSRAPTASATKTLTGLGPIGVFLDGVFMFDSRDGFSVSASNGAEANNLSLGIWNRDAFVNEGVSFDPANAHQTDRGLYHYHANAIALRALLDDNVNFDPVTKLYNENTTNSAPRHSPILGWVNDGFPVYGPYGYANATNSASGVRRMIAGFVPRDLDSTSVSNRTTLPVWAGRAQNRSTTLAAAEYGPPVSGTRPFGRYLEDNDYMGDLGFTQGTHFDLDEFNGRFGATPEFPNGTYAYFAAISSNGAPVFPYNIGRQYFGNPNGGVVLDGTYPEAVTTNYLGGANAVLRMQTPAHSNADADVTLTWSSAEGGAYLIAASTNLTEWATNIAPSVTATNTVTRVTEVGGATGREKRFYRVQRTSLAPYAN